MVCGVRRSQSRGVTIPPEAPLPPTPEPPPPVSEERTRPSGEQLRNLSGLRRTTHASPEGRHIAGVAGGIARHLDVDPLLVRVMLVVAVFFGGAGGIVYVAAWVLAPEEGAEDGMIPVGPPARNLLLWIAGGIAAVSLLGDAFGDTSVPWFWLAVLGAIALWYTNRGKWGHKRNGAPPPPAASTAAAAVNVATAQTSHLPAPWPPGSYDPHAPVTPAGRQRPPLLFGRALAVAALVVGVLGLIDVAGWTPIPTSLYPAALLAVFGGFLVLGAFWGRAGGLIFLGLLALAALPITMIDPSNIETGSSIKSHPQSVAMLESTYQVGAGEILLDMSAIDAETLDGRDVDIATSLGEITVIVPDDATVAVDATVDALGEARIFDETRSEVGGFNLARTHVAGEEGSEPGLADDADLHLTTTAEVGAISVLEESDPRAAAFIGTAERSNP